MRTFKIVRNQDESGISGTGHVIDGVVFDDDTTVIKWLSDRSSIAIYKSFEDFKFLHIDSHPSNNTEIVFDDDLPLPLYGLDAYGVSTEGTPCGNPCDKCYAFDGMIGCLKEYHKAEKKKLESE